MTYQIKGIRRIKLRSIKTGLLLLNCQFLCTLLNILPAAAATEPTISVVQSRENTSQWQGITNRLESAGVNYCVISLNNIRSSADWGSRTVLFLPNVEKLTPSQAITLEEWVNKGGRVIASGPVGSLSAPGVRRLMQNILGGYWGFSLDTPEKLQLSSNKLQKWASSDKLMGEVRGGVVVPDDTNQTAAVWNNKDNSAAVLASDRSTFFGWRWGVDTAANPQLDSAWLQAALKRHTTPSTITSVPGGSPTCANSVAENPNSTPNNSPSSFNITAVVPNNPLPNINFRRSDELSDEPIDHLQDSVRLDIQADSRKPISSNEAIVLQQELLKLIGRVESSNLASAAINPGIQSAKAQSAEFASTQPGALTVNSQQAISQANVIVKQIPQLVAQKKYAEARKQWLTAKASLWNQFPVSRKLAQPEIRAIWLDRGTIVNARNEQGLAQVFDRLSQAGINTVFFETVNAGYTVYPSKVAPQQNPLTRNWDPLKSAVKLAHARNMELHAWVWVFAAGNQRHNQILNIDSNYPGPVLAAHPDWAGYDKRGKMIPQGQNKPFFDPANPQLRQYLLNQYQEIVTNYDVDGLHLDYIRYPFQDDRRNLSYGYGQAARSQFKQSYGVDPMQISPTQTDLWQKWTAFRTQQIDSFVAQVSQKMRQQKPDLIMSVAVFPLPEQERIQKLQQHWEVWANRGDIDLIVPMTYALDTSAFSRLAQPWILSRKLGSALLVPGIRLLNLPTLGAFDQIQLIRDLPVGGYALFAAENLQNQQLQQVFNSTQGQAQQDPIPYRQPFKTAALRYTSLQKEWEFVLQNKQLQMSNTGISEFNAQAEILQNALNQLANSPSTANLQTTKASLTRFQSQFRTLMRQHALNNSYQVGVWENRLATIERLISFGERKNKKS
ncbi:glycoside hydrolase family 10 protein [Rivularia sp. UHCC 0363]|uniref:glycoside hydrolase family 10 protein n=1 Tax=Rivularia sp. UHCC 0363 TaxID=3110244 RepID=UPI002B21E27C|nr:family 10 glycosylhydrolase [Rivularia sp. UHCC 0363]MEA5595520.1 family 10 glycosylhydrolase [Rivularia sp. UHCC 0363]